MKDLSQTIKQINNAKNVTKKLLEKSKFFANFIEVKMDEIGIANLLDDKYKLLTITSSVGSDTSLYLRIAEHYYLESFVTLDTENISATRETKYLHGDYNSAYQLPSRIDILTFIHDSEAILSELASYSSAIDTKLIDKIIEG